MWNTVTTQKWRLLVLRIHRWGGLVAGIPLLVLATTGCVMAFESQIDEFFHPSLFKVLPHGDALPLSAVIDQVAVGLRPQEHIQVCVNPPKPTIASGHFWIWTQDPQINEADSRATSEQTGMSIKIKGKL